MASLTALCSAKGSPGVTTLALALTYAWPNDVLLIDADVVAGSAVLAGHLSGREAHERGLLGLALAHRRNGRLTEDDLWAQSIELAEGRYLLPGLWDPVQAAQMSAVWPALADVVQGLPSVDVIVDVGRLGTAFDASALLGRADLVVQVGRCTLVDAYALTRRLPALRSVAPPDAVRLATVGSPDPYPPAELSRKLGVPLLCDVPWDPPAAAVYSHGRPPGRRRGKAPLDASAAKAAAAVLACVRRPISTGPGGYGA